MNWFIFALCTMLFWGTADLFYKKGADENDKYSHLKTVIAVGAVMGIHAIFTLIFGDIGYNFINILKYLPVSLMYILSMAVGYFGLRYLELSISSPIQNSSGALVCILCVAFLHQTEIFTWQVTLAVVAVCAGVFALGLLEKKESDLLKERGEKKYRIGFVAFFIPVIYCIIDALGTFFDAFYLDDVATTPLVGVTEETLEDVANTSYELTFLLAAIACFIFIKFIKKQKYGIKDIRPVRLGAAAFETAGQFTYVYAMSGQAAVAAPMVAAYSIVSMLLSRAFLKEKLNWKQYLCIAMVMTGVILLGVFADV